MAHLPKVLRAAIKALGKAADAVGGFSERFDSIPKSMEPRMPATRREAERVYRRWDWNNGRYYFEGEVVLDGDDETHNVTFDSDSNIATVIDGKELPRCPQFWNRRVVSCKRTER